MLYQQHNKSYVLWIVIWAFSLVTLISLAGVAQANRTGVNYTSEPILSGWVVNVTEDGKTAVIGSNHVNLGDGNDTNDFTQIYLLDIPTKALNLVSKSITGEEGNHQSDSPFITSDGRYVFYQSSATNLVDETVKPRETLFLFDRTTNTTTAVKLEGEGQAFSFSMSDDARYISYLGKSGNIAVVYLLDRTENTGVALPSNGVYGSHRNAYMTRDGKYVIYSVGSWKVFRYDIKAKTVTEIQKISLAPEVDKDLWVSSISPDGQMVVFSTRRSFVPEDVNDFFDVYLYDFVTDSIRLVSQSSSGQLGNRNSSQGVISADKRTISFQTHATNLDDTIDATLLDTRLSSVMVRDLERNITALASKTFDGAPPLWGGSASSTYSQSISKYLFFHSWAINLVPNDLKDEVGGFYYYDTEEKKVYFVFSPAGAPNPSSHSISGKVTDKDGKGISGAQIITDPAIANYATDSNGSYTIHGLSAGTYVIKAVVPGLAFEPSSTTIVLTADKSNVDFKQICVSPVTGFDMCSIEVGDILLWRGNFFILFQPLGNTAARIGMGSYWWHSGIFVGNGQIAEATGNSNEEADEVWKTYLVDTAWWKGAFLGGYPNPSFDWSVIRPRTTATNKQLAASYAIQMADQDNPPILYIPTDDRLSFYDQTVDSPTYCSKFVWKAYMQANLNLERNMGLLGSTISRSVITPDDLYYSAIDFVGSLDALADIVQEKESLTNNRFIFFMLSPADLLLTDSQGRRVGHDPVSGATYEEIPGAQYSGPNFEPESISLEASSNLTWTLQAVGTDGGGEYTIQTAILSGTQILTGTVTASINTGQKQIYHVNTQANLPSDVFEEWQQQPINDKKRLFLPLINK